MHQVFGLGCVSVLMLLNMKKEPSRTSKQQQWSRMFPNSKIVLSKACYSIAFPSLLPTHLSSTRSPHFFSIQEMPCHRSIPAPKLIDSGTILFFVHVDNGNGSSAIIFGTIAEAIHAVALHLSGCHVSEFITLNLGGAIRPIRTCTIQLSASLNQHYQTIVF